MLPEQVFKVTTMCVAAVTVSCLSTVPSGVRPSRTGKRAVCPPPVVRTNRPSGQGRRVVVGRVVRRGNCGGGSAAARQLGGGGW